MTVSYCVIIIDNFLLVSSGMTAIMTGYIVSREKNSNLLFVVKDSLLYLHQMEKTLCMTTNRKDSILITQRKFLPSLMLLIHSIMCIRVELVIITVRTHKDPFIQEPGNGRLLLKKLINLASRSHLNIINNN